MSRTGLPSSQVRVIIESGCFDLSNLDGPFHPHNDGIDVRGLDLAYRCAVNVSTIATYNLTPQLWTSKTCQLSQHRHEGFCSVCMDFDMWLRLLLPKIPEEKWVWRREKTFYLGFFRAVLKRAPHCRLCQLLGNLVTLRYGQIDSSLLMNHVVQLWLNHETYGLDIHLTGPHADKVEVPRLNFWLKPIADDAQYDLLPEWNQSSGPSDLSLQLARHLNIPRINSWLKSCIEEHDSSCGSPALPQATGELRNLKLLDVTTRKVVTAPKGSIYYALSYVWGGIGPPEPINGITGSTEIWDYSPESIWEAVPRTIRDAVRLVKQLNGRYIWIDSLCINQRDATEKLAQIAQMDKIYSQAILTIIAAAGRDANAGMLGVHPCPRLQPLPAVTIGGITIMSSLSNDHSYWSKGGIIESSFWNKRGWTYQERLLSRRRLIVTDYQAYFMCRGACYSEESGDTKGKGEHHLALDYPHTGTSALKGYFGFLKQFSGRSFSDQSDVLNGPYGALRALAHMHQTDIIWGLPESVFHRAMFWGIDDGDEKNLCAHRRPHIPSWSWASWAGPTSYFDYEHEFFMQSCVKWYTFTINGELRHIDSSRIKEYDIDCGLQITERDSWDPKTYTPPYPTFPPGLHTGKPAEGLSTGLLVGWAVAVPVRLGPCAEEKALREFYFLCDVFFGDDRINLRPVAVSQTWWQSKCEPKNCRAVCIGYSKAQFSANWVDEMYMLLVERDESGISTRIGIFTLDFELFKTGDLKWELIQLL